MNLVLMSMKDNQEKIFASGKIAKLLTMIITNIGLAPYVAFIVASFVFYYQLRDSIRVLQYDLETMIEKVLLTLKKLVL